MDALLSWDLDQVLPYTLALAAADSSPAVRLYQYLVHDVTHLATAPYNLSSIYAEDVIGNPSFARWSKKRARLHANVESIVSAGIVRREFVDFPSALVREIVVGIMVRTETLYSGRRRPVSQLADQIATILLRGLLVDPSTVDEIRRSADAPGSLTEIAPADDSA